MNGDLISREALKNAVEKRIWYIAPAYDEIMAIIDNAPTVEITEEQAIDRLHETRWLPRHDKEMTERPQDELTEIKHRLNLLIGVLYSNQLISQSDFDYMEDSIKKLMKGGAE